MVIWLLVAGLLFLAVLFIIMGVWLGRKEKDSAAPYDSISPPSFNTPADPYTPNEFYNPTFDDPGDFEPETGYEPRPKAELPPSIAGEGCAVLFGLGWTLFSLVFVVLGGGFTLNEWQTYSTLSNEGQVVTGVVIDREIEYDSEDGDSYYLTYRYVVPAPSGEQIQFSRSEIVGEDFYNGHPLESRVDVLYAPSNPTLARLNARFGFHNVLVASLFILFGGVFVLIGVGLTIAGFVAAKRTQRIKNHGQRTTATLYNRWKDTDSDGDTIYCVAYHFSPPGHPEVVKGEISRPAYRRMDETNQMTVRYDPQKPSHCYLEVSG
jgi:hypothetical protein